jgi:hypothetical protein
MLSIVNNSHECLRGYWRLHKILDARGSVNNSFSVLSVSFDSLAPTRLTFRANLRLLYLKDPAFSIVVNFVEFGLSKLDKD